jgi:queuosine precursor transporter
MKNLRFFPLVTAVFVTALLISNIVAAKLIQVGPLVLPAAVILFPVTYIFGDVLTEVYGYARARQVIWTGFACNLLAVGVIWLAGLLPAASFWTAGAYATSREAQSAYWAILGSTPRILVASFAAYLVGEFLNSLVLARLKVMTSGRWLWVRTILSTIVGQGADSAIFITVAFGGILPISGLTAAIISQWLVKSAYEALATPLTYLTVNGLKRAEAIDVFDTTTNFSPFAR